MNIQDKQPIKKDEVKDIIIELSKKTIITGRIKIVN